MTTAAIVVQAWHLDGSPSGARSRLLGLFSGLAEVGQGLPRIEVWVSAQAPPDAALRRLVARIDGATIRAVPLPPGPTLKRAAAERRRLPRLLARAGARLLDLQTLPVPKLALPVVLTIHDLRDLGPDGRGWRRAVAARVLAEAGRRARLVVTPSPQTTHALAEREGFEKVAIRSVPCAVPPAIAEARPPAPLKAYAIHVGRPEPRKNLPFLLEAYARASERAEGLPPLLLAGPSGARAWKELARLARRLAIEDRVRFRFDPADEELPELLGSAWVLAFPSRLEGFGLPVLEAAALGVPSLVLEGGPPAWVAGPAGLPLPPDPKAWAEAFVRLHTDPKFREGMARHAAERAERFAPAACARALLEAWDEALGGG